MFQNDKELYMLILSKHDLTAAAVKVVMLYSLVGRRLYFNNIFPAFCSPITTLVNISTIVLHTLIVILSRSLGVKFHPSIFKPISPSGRQY